MIWRQLLSAAALAGLAAAQVHTDCNPMERDDCPPDPALSTSHSWNFTTRPDGKLWETTAGTVHYEAETGARFTIEKQRDSPTIRSRFYIFFGRVEFMLRAAPGRGIVSSFMLLSDNLDEIDWEFLGTDPRGTTNFYGKGIEDYTNGEYHDMDATPHDDFHNYTTVWTEQSLDFYIDDRRVRSVRAGDVTSNGTDIYPQTPMRVHFGIWAGGDPSLDEWTREWAGGDTDFDDGPFDMYVRSARVEDYGSGREYVFGDRSGDWESIEAVEGNSTAHRVINQEPEEPSPSVSERFNNLPLGARIAVYAASAALGALLIAAALFYCVRQRRRGAREARAALQHSENERMALGNRYEKVGAGGPDTDAFSEHAPEYGYRDVRDPAPAAAAPSSPFTDNDERGWASAGALGAAGAGAGAGAVVMRSQTQSPGAASMRSHTQSPRGLASPPPIAPARTPSPGMTRSPGSPGPQQAYGAHRMQHQQGSAPGSPMSPPPPATRNFSGTYEYNQARMSPGPHGHRQ